MDLSQVLLDKQDWTTKNFSIKPYTIKKGCYKLNLNFQGRLYVAQFMLKVRSE